jgi:hypothetical protein
MLASISTWFQFQLDGTMETNQDRSRSMDRAILPARTLLRRKRKKRVRLIQKPKQYVSGSEGLGDMRATRVIWANVHCELIKTGGQVHNTTSTLKLERTLTTISITTSVSRNKPHAYFNANLDHKN